MLWGKSDERKSWPSKLSCGTEPTDLRRGRSGERCRTQAPVLVFRQVKRTIWQQMDGAIPPAAGVEIGRIWSKNRVRAILPRVVVA